MTDYITGLHSGKNLSSYFRRNLLFIITKVDHNGQPTLLSDLLRFFPYFDTFTSHQITYKPQFKTSNDGPVRVDCRHNSISMYFRPIF